MTARILVVDDQENIRNVLSQHLESLGYQVDTAADGPSGIEMFELNIYNLVICDFKMPGMDGIEMMTKVRELNPDALFMVITAFGSMEGAVESMRAGAFDYVTKPFKLEQIEVAVQRALQSQQLKMENRYLRREVVEKYQFSSILGKSASMLKVFDRIQKLVKVNSTVLITGETGTGKELVAKAIHFNSPRQRNTFVAVNCGAIPDKLLESELFGHSRGAFTDAYTAKKGKFEEADGGTIFLDEIGEMTQALQVKLLRVLQDSEITRLGEVSPRKVDVRVLISTNRELQKEVKEGRFREDLYFRINVVPIEMPPLRERRDDIPLLLGHYLSAFNAEMGKQLKGFTPDAMKVLVNYRWPGNVRQLQNLVERVTILKDEGYINVEDLPSEVAPDIYSETEAGAVSVKLPPEAVSIREFGARVQQMAETILIQRALEITGGNKTEAAALLEISERSLFYKLKNYNIK